MNRNSKGWLAVTNMLLLLLITACGGGGSSSGGSAGAGEQQPIIRGSRMLNDTGWDVCMAATGGSSTLPTRNWSTDPDCGPSSYPGQDALHGRDAQARAGTLVKSGRGPAGYDFTKLSETTGLQLPRLVQDKDWQNDGSEAAGTQWGCVRDNVTGLVWEAKTEDKKSLRYRYWTYLWHNPDNRNNGGEPGTRDLITGDADNCLDPRRCDTQSYIEDINAMNGGAGLCGRNDWRLPATEELVGAWPVVFYSAAADYYYHEIFGIWTGETLFSEGAIPSARMLDLDGPRGLSWTDTLYSYMPKINDRYKNGEQAVVLVSGEELHANVTQPGCSRNILASKIDAIYTDHGDGTVTDNQTGLMWRKCPLGLTGEDCSENLSIQRDHYTDFKSVTDGGYNDWRLPSLIELYSLYEPACAARINTNIFPNSRIASSSIPLSTLVTYSDDRVNYMVSTFTYGLLTMSLLGPSVGISNIQIRLVRDTE